MAKTHKLNVSQIMIWVIAACVPALIFLTYWQGMGFLVNMLVAAVSGIIFDAFFERKTFDYSTLLTAVLFAAGVPAFASSWVLIVGMFFAIVITKHLFGGLGHNIFNPAMVAYAVVLTAFPSEMVVWPAWSVDTISAATPLDHANQSLFDHDLIPSFILNGLWLFGGLILLFKRIIHWQIPVGFLLGMLLCALFFPHPFMQIGLGATMIGAFFIATDPVTAPITARMRFIYGIMIGCLLIILRQYSSYPDGLAFAILLANISTPFLDQWSIRKFT